MAYLGYGLSQGEGFIVVTGDIGAGKTTLVGHLVDTIDAARLRIITLVSTQMNPEDLLRLVADGLGVDGRGLGTNGRASWRDRGWQSVVITVAAVSLKKKIKNYKR